MRRAIVLLSGGLDSATALYWAKEEGYRAHCLSFDYGQRHRRELEAARAIAKAVGCPHQVIQFTLPWGGSALTDSTIAVPQARSLEEIGRGIPATYVPARNTIFLSFAASFAEAIGAQAVVMGANQLDFSGYPDCRGPYYRVMERVLAEGTKAGTEGRPLKILTPLIQMTKADIVRLGVQLEVPFELTRSCYLGEDRPCGRCDSCLLRQKGFQEAGVVDPLDEPSRIR